MAEPTTAPIKHPDRFFIDGSWAAPSSAAKIDVINSATEELFVRVAEAQTADVERAVAAARQAFDRGPWPRMKHAERAKYLRAIAKRDGQAHRRPRADLDRESGVIHGIAKGGSIGDRQHLRLLRGPRRHVPVRGAAPARARQRQRRPDRARAGRRRRRDHPLERARLADRLQVRARAARGLHGDPQGVARSPRRRRTCSRKSARRSACPRACSTCSRPIARCRSCSCATPASTR